MSDPETNVKDNVANTMEVDGAEDESKGVTHKPGRKWAWIGASVLGVVLVGAVGAGVGAGAGKNAEDGATPPFDRERAVERSRGDYELYAKDENADGRLPEPACWIGGPENLPVKVLSYSASEIVFAEGEVEARNDVVCGGGGRGAASDRRRLSSSWRRRLGNCITGGNMWHGCERYPYDCNQFKATSGPNYSSSEEMPTHFDVTCWSDCNGIPAHAAITESGEGLTVLIHNHLIKHGTAVDCRHSGWFENHSGSNMYSVVGGGLKVGTGNWGPTTCSNIRHWWSQWNCDTHQNCIAFSEKCL